MQRYFSLSNQHIELSNDDIYHILKVMRGKVSSTFEVVHLDAISVCEITSINPFAFKVIDVYKEDKELFNNVTLFYVLSKGDKNEFVIQKATELGVKNIVFLNSKRSIIKLSQSDFERKLVRYKKIAKEASEQSKRNIIPDIKGLYDLDKIPNELLCDHNLVAYELESGKTNKTLDFLQENCKNSESISVLIGPEGGIDEKEISVLTSNNFIPISLGKRILRTETAAVYALSVIAFILEAK